MHTQKTNKHKLFNRVKLHNQGKIKRNMFANQTKNEVDTIYVIGECCILSNEYPENFKSSTLY